MYPKISDFLNDIFHTTWWLLPVQTFGFFVALAFMVAFYVLQKEFTRRTAIGQLPTRPAKIMVGGSISPMEILTQGLIYGLLGYKLGLFVEDYRFFASNPQEVLNPISRGSILWALVLGGGAAAWKGYEFMKKKDEKPREVSIQAGLNEDSGTMFTLAFIFGISGAKLFHCLENWGQFIENPLDMLLSFDGLTFYGGLICATIAIAIYVNKKGYNVLTVADSVFPVIMLGYGIGRFGCHFAGDGDWGIPNLSPNPGLPAWLWSYTYPHNVISEGVPIAGCLGEHCTQLPEGVYPTPLYEALVGISLFFVLWSMRKKLPFVGQLTGIYLMFNGMERFLIEQIRVNTRYEFWGLSITQAEIISSILFLIGVIFFLLSTYVWKTKNIGNQEPKDNLNK